MDTRNVNGLSYERLYQVYNGMISRCYNKNHPHYELWGGRGITVCDEWKTDYQSFRKWAYENGYDDKRDRKFSRSIGLTTMEITARKIADGRA